MVVTPTDLPAAEARAPGAPAAGAGTPAAPAAAGSPTDGGMGGRILDFLAYLEFERGLSRNTLEAYRSDLLQLGAFLGRRGVDVVAADHADLSAFLAELAAGGGRR